MEKVTNIFEQLRSNQPQIRNQAFKKLYTKTFAQVLSYVTKNSGRYEDAKDVLQDAMSIVFEKVIDENFTLNPNTSIATYVNAVARNKWKQRLQKNKKLAFYEDLKDTDEGILSKLNQQYSIICEGDQIVEVWVNEKGNENLNEIAENIVLELLSRKEFSKCKAIIWDFYRHEMSMEQIAHKHNYKNDKTAKVKKAKCLARLRKYCEKIPFLQRHFRKKERKLNLRDSVENYLNNNNEK